MYIIAANISLSKASDMVKPDVIRVRTVGFLQDKGANTLNPSYNQLQWIQLNKIFFKSLLLKHT